MSDQRDILSELQQINQKLDILIELNREILKDCNRMDTHIDFVNNVYDGLKYPLDFIKNKINYLSGASKPLTSE